ncbi:MAG: tetratricopeptide repeat protein, partial [Xanthomonadales bacterium]|nr:tetratricopeptide repeat protein [Xanthomonadales bacterium]
TPQEASHLAQTRKVNPDAYDAYLRGRHFWEQRTLPSFGRALEFYEQAIELDPEYAQVHAAVASAHMLRAIYEYSDPIDAYEQAREAAQRAIEIDPSVGEAYSVLAHIIQFVDRDWDLADQTFREAIRLSPKNVQTHLFYAFYLMVSNRLEDAENTIADAERVDPLSPLAGAFRVQLAMYRDQADAAIEIAVRNLEIYPDFPATLWRIGEAYLMAGKPDKAVEAFERLVFLTDRSPLSLSLLGMAYGKSGQAELAKVIAGEIAANTPNPSLLAGRLARISLGLGEHALAIQQVQESLGSAQFSTVELHASPLWASLREDPRIGAIIDQIMGSSEAESSEE